MKRLIPDSILGRTALVMVVAVAVSLGLAALTFGTLRHEALAALGGRHAAERVAALVTLLEDSAPEARRHTLAALETPGFRAGWGGAPVVAQDERRGLAHSIAYHLRTALDGRTVRVATTSSPPLPQPGTGLGGGRRMMHGGGAMVWGGYALSISVMLRDGSWLNVVAPIERGESLWRARVVVPLSAALMAVILASLWAVRRATRPFATFAAAAARLGLDVGAPPLPEDGPKEVRRAAQAFNLMQSRIRRFVDDRTQMLAAISHDLRTPITRLKLRAEFMEDDGERARMLADLDEMERMIAATLAFARDDAAREERRALDAAALVQGLADDLAAAGFDSCYDGPANLVIEARPMALKRAIANLLDNAVKYGEAARATIRETDGEIAIVIDDRGPGIPAQDRERVFTPFVRLESSRNRDTGGTGLGLAIARAAIRAQGGDITLENREDGGLRVTVIVPKLKNQ